MKLRWLSVRALENSLQQCKMPMVNNSLEKGIVLHCAPTLAGMKTAGLFRHFYQERSHVMDELDGVNRLLNGRGVYVEILRWDEKAALVYVYRLSHLRETLIRKEVIDLLSEYDYQDMSVEACILHLKTRLLDEHSCFPHEIGVFLGYPMKDVRGFIENKGENCKCCGMWKVYGDEKEEEKLFCKYKKCAEIYQHCFSCGRALVQMTVCA